MQYFFSRDLSFKKGDIILLRKKIDANWYYGENAGIFGVFPLTYVQVNNYVRCMYMLQTIIYIEINL